MNPGTLVIRLQRLLCLVLGHPMRWQSLDGPLCCERCGRTVDVKVGADGKLHVTRVIKP
jgi:endogenous inhibitor of DNA gyrase (YacG/DUF329 family)